MLYECLSQDFWNLFPDIFGSNALRLQTPVPRTDVYEYCTSYDECLALKGLFSFNYETQVLRFFFHFVYVAFKITILLICCVLFKSMFISCK